MAKKAKKHAPKRSKRGKRAQPKRRSKKSSKRTSRPRHIPSGDAFEIAFKLLREGRTQKRAAELAGISTGRFRRFLRGHKLARFRNGRWRVTDRRSRQIRIISNGKSQAITVRGFARASIGMRHLAAVWRFLDSNNVAELAPFERQSIADIDKKEHLLETRPNVLLRLANTGSDAEMKIYRLLD